MLNVFYMYGGMWLLILLLYSFGWSDLCIPLTGDTLCFVFFMIISAGILGFFLRKKFKFFKLEKNPHKKPTLTVLLVIFFVVEFIYAGQIPLINVISGKEMVQGALRTIPMLSFLVSGFHFIYCFYLAYLFVCFKTPRLLLEYAVCFLYFILMYQRQNIMIIFLGSFWILLASIPFKKFSFFKKVSAVLITVIAVLILLYIFGIIGNSRYGIWDANDASMIVEVGKINDKFPNFIPKSYAWAYVYAISPLSNLQYNINLGVIKNAGFIDAIWQYLPNFISKRLFVQSIVGSEFITPALIVCTAFSDAYRASGIAGMYLFYIIETAVVVIFIKLYDKELQYRIGVQVLLAYFYLLSFFVNPIIYDTTSLILIYLLFFKVFKKLFYKKKLEQRIKKLEKNYETS